MQFGRTPELDDIDFSLPPLSARAEAVLARTPRAASDPWLRLGAPAFRRRDWLGTLYPAGAPEGDWLPIYARKLGAVELNSTFYGLPSETTLARWCEDTPPQFRFCPKVPRSISHELSGTQRSALTSAFVLRLKRLGERLGPALLQLPETIGPSAQPAIRTALESFPEDFPLALELRHAAWFERGALRDDLAEWLEVRRVACVITDVAGRRDVSHGSLTVPHAFVRFVGEGGHVTDEPRTAAWVDTLRRWRERGLHDAYFFVHQPDDILAPQLLAAASTHARGRGLAVPAAPLERPASKQLGLF